MHIITAQAVYTSLHTLSSICYVFGFIRPEAWLCVGRFLSLGIFLTKQQKMPKRRQMVRTVYMYGSLECSESFCRAEVWWTKGY
jgi:hypothetical protein